MTEIEKLYNEAIKHVEQHNCSAKPYQYADKLFKIVAVKKPAKILEIGTGMGFTAAVMALANPEAEIQTMEKDSEHVKASQEFFAAHNFNRIKILQEAAEAYMPLMQDQLDLIFFDGFQIHYEFLPQYYRLLKPGGTLVLANNHLQSKTSDQFFAELNNPTNWKIIEKFGDTTVAERI